MNFCQEFFSSNTQIDVIEIFRRLMKNSPSPFSTLFKFNDKYLISSSPERYIRKEGNRLISQPIKGTARRGKTAEEDEINRQKLLQSQKEQSENVMIVDLVRNDMSKTAVPGSVKVEELYGIYSFPQVHQMISTVVSQINDSIHFTDCIKTTFPMGSMTGAPKIRAMEIIEKYETTKRGLFSGAVGYITPEADFDFNVVIRSILYNESNQYVSIITGGAITDLSDPEAEYEESLLKANALINVLKAE
jgi:para-aminobenzoate synthetase component 1